MLYRDVATDYALPGSDHKLLLDYIKPTEWKRSETRARTGVCLNACLLNFLDLIQIQINKYIDI